MRRDKNSFCYFILIFSYVVGVLLYHIHKINIVDEAIALMILCYYIQYAIKERCVEKKVKYVLSFLLFYLIYSLCLCIVDPRAVFLDLLQQSKPLISFFLIYAMKPSLNSTRKRRLLSYAFVFSIFSFILFLLTDDKYFFHRGYYGHVILISAFLYLLGSQKTKKNIVVFFMIMSLGLLCTRSKFYGDYALALVLFMVVKEPVKFNFKYVFLGAITLFVVIFAAWEKFNMYFVEGLDNDEIARNMLYYKSVQVLQDFFPFGAGLGSYGVDASKVYYSPLYYKYDLYSVWGLSEEYGEFIPDTFFPAIIGEFGLIGLYLFYRFIRFFYDKANALYNKNNLVLYKMVLISVFVILIESIASPMLVTTTGSFFLIIIAYCLCEMENKTDMNCDCESDKKRYRRHEGKSVCCTSSAG